VTVSRWLRVVFSAGAGSVGGEEGAHAHVGMVMQFVLGELVAAGVEHGPVERDGQDEPHELPSGQLRVIDDQLAPAGQALQVVAEFGDGPPRAAFPPQVAELGEAAGPGAGPMSRPKSS
jgi:hypothetical protein